MMMPVVISWTDCTHTDHHKQLCMANITTSYIDELLGNILVTLCLSQQIKHVHLLLKYISRETN